MKVTLESPIMQKTIVSIAVKNKNNMGAIKHCTTFQDFKDLACIRKQWIDFKDMYDVYENQKNGFKVIEDFTSKAAELYAKFKADEAVKEYKAKKK